MCAQLGSFVTFVLNYVPAVEKTLALWTQSGLHLTFIQCFTTSSDVANINSKLRSLACLFNIILFSVSAFLVQFISSYRSIGKSRPDPFHVNKVHGATLEAHLREWLQESITEELSSNRHWLVSLFKWSQQFAFGPPKAIIISLQSLFSLRLTTTDQLGFVSTLSSVFGSLDSIIVLYIAIFLNVLQATELPSFAKSMGGHLPISNDSFLDSSATSSHHHTQSTLSFACYQRASICNPVRPCPKR